MDMVKFYSQMNALKEIKRAGWVEREVKNPESVADHSFMMALMCMTMPSDGINREKAIKMALVHDIAESEVGDIITKENWPEKGTMKKAEKRITEQKALNKILADIDEETAKEIKDLWNEFEEGKTREAIFVKDIDNFERIFQAYLYHVQGNFKKPLEGFWNERSMESIKNDKLKNLLRNLIDRGR